MSDGDLAERIRAVLSGPHVTEKKMFGGICFLYDGHMMVAASKRGLLVRVGRAAYADALKQPATRPMEQNGRKFPGYIHVAEDGTRRDADLRRWIDAARAEIATLPPKDGSKPSKRPARKPARSRTA
jgi:TfoX/Sxy family transcriptional regulator of competence genes